MRHQGNGKYALVPIVIVPIGFINECTIGPLLRQYGASSGFERISMVWLQCRDDDDFPSLDSGPLFDSKLDARHKLDKGLIRPVRDVLLEKPHSEITIVSDVLTGEFHYSPIQKLLTNCLIEKTDFTRLQSAGTQLFSVSLPD